MYHFGYNNKYKKNINPPVEFDDLQKYKPNLKKN